MEARDELSVLRPSGCGLPLPHVFRHPLLPVAGGRIVLPAVSGFCLVPHLRHGSAAGVEPLVQHDVLRFEVSPVTVVFLGCLLMRSAFSCLPSSPLPSLVRSLTFMLVYLWAKRNPQLQISLLGLLAFNAPYLPWVLLAFSGLLGHDILSDALGITVGHAYYFFEDVWPALAEARGWRRLKRPLGTPIILHWIFRTPAHARNRGGGNAEDEAARLAEFEVPAAPAEELPQPEQQAAEAEVQADVGEAPDASAGMAAADTETMPEEAREEEAATAGLADVGEEDVTASGEGLRYRGPPPAVDQAEVLDNTEQEANELGADDS